MAFKEFSEIECAVSGGNKLTNGINLDINFKKIILPSTQGKLRFQCIILTLKFFCKKHF